MTERQLRGPADFPQFQLAVRVLESAIEQLSKSGDERCSVRTLTALGKADLDCSDEEAAMDAFRSGLDRSVSPHEGRNSLARHRFRV